jgi:hypothetical protein
LQNTIPRLSAQQTVTPDAVTRVFPCVGGYKEFAPEIGYLQTRVFTGAQFFTPAYHNRCNYNRSTRTYASLPGAGEPGSWAAEKIQRNSNTTLIHKN